MTTPTHPSNFEAVIGGHFGPTYRAEGLGDSLSYQHSNDGEVVPLEPGDDNLIAPTPQQWAAFEKSLNRIKVWEWDKEYQDYSILDGTSWHVEIQWGERSVAACGSNAFPDTFGSFLRALRKLLGGRKFD